MYLTFYRINYTRNILNPYFVLKIKHYHDTQPSDQGILYFQQQKNFFLNEFNIIYEKAIFFFIILYSYILQCLLECPIFRQN